MSEANGNHSTFLTISASVARPAFETFPPPAEGDEPPASLEGTEARRRKKRERSRESGTGNTPHLDSRDVVLGRKDAGWEGERTALRPQRSPPLPLFPSPSNVARILGSVSRTDGFSQPFLRASVPSVVVPFPLWDGTETTSCVKSALYHFSGTLRQRQADARRQRKRGTRIMNPRPLRQL